MSLGQIIQLAALGVQNLYLNIKPQYTMFRKSYKRHTNYATQVVKIDCNTSASWGSKIDFDLTRNGDLVAETYLVVQLPCITGGYYDSTDSTWWPTAYKAVPGYVNKDKDWYSGQGDHLVIHTGAGLDSEATSSAKRVKGVLGHVHCTSADGGWRGHANMSEANSKTNGTTSGTGILVGPSHSQVAYCDALGHAIVKDARFSIAQNVIQEFTGEYMHIHHLMNNPAESLTEALFCYGDDMHAQGPQGGTLADGVGFQASKYGHQAIATGGYWVDMVTTATNPAMNHAHSTKAHTTVKYSTDGTYRHTKTQVTGDGDQFAKLESSTAVSKIGRSMAFLPLASQTYIGMCFHNTSAANAHIDYTDKGMDTRSAETAYIGGIKIGSSAENCLISVANSTHANDYSNWDELTTATTGISAAQFWNSQTGYGTNDTYTTVTDFLKDSDSTDDGGYFLVPRGLKSRTQPRGIGLHDHAGYHGSLVRVEDSVGSGLHVSDKYIGLDEFNASQSVTALRSATSGLVFSGFPSETVARTHPFNADGDSTAITNFEVGDADVSFFFGDSLGSGNDLDATQSETVSGSSLHSNAFSFKHAKKVGDCEAGQALRVYTQSATIAPALARGLQPGDPVYFDELQDHNSVLLPAERRTRWDTPSRTHANNGTTGRELVFPTVLSTPAQGVWDFNRDPYFLIPNPANNSTTMSFIVVKSSPYFSDHATKVAGHTFGPENTSVASDAAVDAVKLAANAAYADLLGLRVGDLVGAQFMSTQKTAVGSDLTAHSVSGLLPFIDVGEIGVDMTTTSKYETATTHATGITTRNKFKQHGFRVEKNPATDKYAILESQHVISKIAHITFGDSGKFAIELTIAPTTGSAAGTQEAPPSTDISLGEITATGTAPIRPFGSGTGASTTYPMPTTAAARQNSHFVIKEATVHNLAMLRLRFHAKDITPRLLGYVAADSLQSWADSDIETWAAAGGMDKTADMTPRSGLTGGNIVSTTYKLRAVDVVLCKTKEGALKGTDNFVDLSSFAGPSQPFNAYVPFGSARKEQYSWQRNMCCVHRKPMTGLSEPEFKALAKTILAQSGGVITQMVTQMLRDEFHRGAKQSGSQYFDSESTAGCGPRVSLGALQYTAACAQPIGSAPAMSQLAADIVIPQTCSVIADAAKGDLNFATRMMVALDRSSSLSKLAGTDSDAHTMDADDDQDKESARLVKNYNPGPGYEVASGRLDTSMYSKLRTHAQMNTGFGRRAQVSAAGNHQMEDGSGKCVQVVVPMPWWYADGPACDGRRTQALPMIALQYHNVSISVNLRSLSECIQTDREHRSQPFRCSKMIGSLGQNALVDSTKSKIGAAGATYGMMPSVTHGAREGSTMVDTLGPSAQERAVCCVNMHHVRDTLQGLKYKNQYEFSGDLTSHKEGDRESTFGGGHLVMKDMGGTAPGYQGVTDERYHVDVGTWLNFSSKNYMNAEARGKARFTARLGLFDGEFGGSAKSGHPLHTTKKALTAFTTAGVANSNAKLVPGLTAEKYGGSDGNLGDWGQGKFNAQMSSDTSTVLSSLKSTNQVKVAALFGKAQTNGGFACWDSQQGDKDKYALVGKARPCAMHDIMSNATTCSTFSTMGGTMGWKTNSAKVADASLQIISAHLLVTYIFLDSAERRLFASNAHEYLITQIQRQEFSSRNIAHASNMHQINCDLKFNHPVSHLFWVLQRPESKWAREWFRYEATHGAGDPLMIKAELTLNSSKREDETYMNAMNTTVIEPWNYFKKCNNTGIGGALKDGHMDGSARNIHTYSFSQNPGEWYPTGSLNFSRIDRVELKLFCKAHAESHLTHPLVWGGGGYRELQTEITNAYQTNTVDGVEEQHTQKAVMGEIAQGIDVTVYARNFNVLRIQSGMGAIKYAN